MATPEERAAAAARQAMYEENEQLASKISFEALLSYAGLQRDVKAGRTGKFATYRRIDSNNKPVGNDFVYNKADNSCFERGVHRPVSPIGFIKIHPDLFPGNGLSSEVERINKILHDIDNSPQTITSTSSQTYTPVQFNVDNYKLEYLTEENRKHTFSPYFYPRQLYPDTQLAFKDHVCLVTDNQRGFKNLGFPYHTAEDPTKIVGIDMRYLKPDKDGNKCRNAEGTDKSNGMWIANLGDKPLSEAKHIFWFEGAYDAMAFYQAQSGREKFYKDKGWQIKDPILLGYKDAVYVSVGGQLTANQVKGMLKAAPQAEHYLGFDRDVAGARYNILFAEQVSGKSLPIKEFSKEADTIVVDTKQYKPSSFDLHQLTADFELDIPNIHINQCKPEFKDWNDQVMYKKRPPVHEELNQPIVSQQEAEQHQNEHRTSSVRR